MKNNLKVPLSGSVYSPPDTQFFRVASELTILASSANPVVNDNTSITIERQSAANNENPFTNLSWEDSY